jgi:pyridoxal phosphate enzyme (YggS family)
VSLDAATRLARVRAEVAHAAEQAGRSPAAVRIIAVSKYADVEAVRALADAGQEDFGENYVQPALAKMQAVERPHLRWHLIGALQSNKAARAASAFHLIHSVSSESALRAIARAMEKTQGTCRVLIQIWLGGGGDRAGIAPNEAAAFLNAATIVPGILVDGVMGVAPVGGEPRRHFARLREVLESLRASRFPNAPLREMSAGMSEDFADAIREGATMVRIGRALFGESSA